MSATTTAPTCPALIQQGPRKGQTCGNKTTSTYCIKHARQTVHDKARAENVRYCDIARGCYVVLEEHQAKCTNCLRKAQILDRKRHGKKRADSTLCLDCGNPLTPESQAKGKHERLLRRCVPCYEKLQKVEQERKPRERNYKAEAFTNKHVIWNHYVKGAKKRGIHFTLPKKRFESLITQPCFYCAYQKQGEVNGIDRVDNNKGYVEENVVSCCQTCNEAKGTQHPQEFIDKLQAIQQYRMTSTPISPEAVEQWKETYLSRIVPTYRTYSKNANTRNLEFMLTEDEFTHIVQQPCYLCGIPTSDQNHNGVDRVENTEGYLLSNCKSCCGHCNLLKKQAILQDIYRMAEQISNRYGDITAFLATKDIPHRVSKVAGREKVKEPLLTESPLPKEYKSTEEVVPATPPPPKEIVELLEAKSAPPAPPKQWKSSMIHRAIQNSQENEYKAFCEENNDMSLLPNWVEEWATFVLSVKGKTETDALPLITAFVENLRRIRHNKLCFDKNATLVDKEDRQQWPATTVVRAFLDGKLASFKNFTEAYTNESPADPKWVKRWTAFVNSLENARDDQDKMKTLCSKFMTAQRTKKYRHSKAGTSGAGTSPAGTTEAEK
jgi:hypothetical protein